MYVEPILVEDPHEGFFYHKIDLPSFGTVGGDWDLRDCTDAYLGNYEFRGKRVLDVGAASGYLTFEMEKRGAEVVAFDLDDGANWNIVPHFKLADELDEIRRQQAATLTRLKKAFWLSHRDLGSDTKAFYGDIYEIDERLGEFDVVYYGMIVGHLRDPYQALFEGARRAREAVIVTSIFEMDESPTATFIPSPDRWDNLAIKSWWSMTTGIVGRMLGTLGFEIADVVESTPMITAADFQPGRRTCRTVVARRVS